MSSAATAGPPPNRHEPTTGDGPAGGSHASNGVKAAASSSNRGTNRVFPHIDDLLAAQPDVNALAPIRRLLLEGESYAKQADTNLDFRRPDIALQEYIKASIIIVNIIPRHKDYPELKSDRGDLHRLYAGLQKRISIQHEKFEEIKEVIKEDNARSGVQPTVSSGPSKGFAMSEQNGEPRPRPQSGQIQSVQKQLMGSVDVPPDGGDFRSSDMSLPSSPPPYEENTSARQKPPVQPKPNALHGKVIKPNTEEDLATRFSRLRGAGSHSQVQDPRIRTRLIGMPDAADLVTKRSSAPLSSPVTNNIKPRPDRPLGPRDMPKLPTGPPIPQKVPVNMEIPSMPKPPDAIYSPAWNSDNPAGLDMLRSTSRSVFNGTGRPHAVSPTTHVLHSSTATNGRNGQAAPPHDLPNGTSPKKSLDRKLPDALTVAAEELMEYLQRGSRELSILLVDIRDREEFDNGHIMSHSIICIEPIILRKEISAEELEQSLVLAPDAEQRLFNARDTFDIVIYYDQSSSSNEHRGSGRLSEETILMDFSKAVYDYGYEKRLKRPPRLLVGGLDAWVDLVGLGALETPQLSNPTSSRGAKGAPDSLRAVRVRETNNFSARRKTREVKPLSKEEQKRWEEAIKEDAAAIVRTTEDFFRRFPEPSAIQESMVSPSPFSDSESSNRANHGNTSVEVNAQYRNQMPSMPQIPTRPAPALPRQSYSGVSERTNFSSTTNLIASPFGYKDADTISHQVNPYGRTGIENLGQTCYMSSVFQALKGTRVFRSFMTDWSPGMTPIPKAPDEQEAPLQLLMLQFKNMFKALCDGLTEKYNPKNLAEYIYQTQAGLAREDRFGGKNQHDAEEFLGFILENLERELNAARDRKPLMKLTTSQEEVRRKQPDIRSCWMEWQRFLHTNNSFISRNFRGQTISYFTCPQCKFAQKSWEPWLDIHLEIPDDGVGTLEQSLNRRFNSNQVVNDYRCDNCKHYGGERRDRLSRCPEVLIIMLRRHAYDIKQGRPQKVRTKVVFPLDGLSLDPYFISLEGRGTEDLDNGVLMPFIYDCYAVIQHRGDTIYQGHYWALVRERDPDDPIGEAWYRYDDTRVTKIARKDVNARTQSNQTYVLFYQRRPNHRN